MSATVLRLLLKPMEMELPKPMEMGTVLLLLMEMVLPKLMEMGMAMQPPRTEMAMELQRMVMVLATVIPRRILQTRSSLTELLQPMSKFALIQPQLLPP